MCCVTCHVLYVACHMSHFLPIAESSLWRVCYQRGLLCLVLSQLLTAKSLKLNQIKERHNIQAQGQHVMIMLCSANITRKNPEAKLNQRSKYRLRTREARQDDFFL